MFRGVEGESPSSLATRKFVACGMHHGGAELQRGQGCKDMASRNWTQFRQEVVDTVEAPNGLLLSSRIGMLWRLVMQYCDGGSSC